MNDENDNANDNWLQEFNDYYDTYFAVDDDYYFAFDYET